MDFDKEVDARGLNCPLPILRAKKALAEMQPGQVLHVLAAARQVRAIDAEDEAALGGAAEELHWLSRDWPRICARAGRGSRRW